MMRAALPLLLALGGGLSTGACAFASKGEPLSPRYFSPAGGTSAGGVGAAQANVELRLGQIESAAHLEERIAYRASETELGYYEDRRWTELPEGYLRRQLVQELFEVRGVRRVVSGAGATLDVELVSFEEVREGEPRARLALRFSLRDERRSRLERSLVIEEPLGSPAPDDAGQALAEAMTHALTRAVNDVADQVIRQLEAPDTALAEQTSDAGQPSPAR
jgi:cholesterol transport system auxiliary component